MSSFFVGVLDEVLIIEVIKVGHRQSIYVIDGEREKWLCCFDRPMGNSIKINV